MLGPLRGRAGFYLGAQALGFALEEEGAGYRCPDGRCGRSGGRNLESAPPLPAANRSPNSAHRKVGSRILFTVLESATEGFQLRAARLFELFGQLPLIHGLS